MREGSSALTSGGVDVYRSSNDGQPIEALHAGP